MLKTFQLISVVVTIVLTLYLLVSQNFAWFPLLLIPPFITLILRTLEDFKKGRKIKGVASIVIIVILLLVSIYTVLMN